MYSLETREHVDKIFRNLAKKNPRQIEILGRKIQEKLEDPHRFKPMHFPLSGMRRVHFGSFVLMYSIDEQRGTFVLEDHEHHDRVYNG